MLDAREKTNINVSFPRIKLESQREQLSLPLPYSLLTTEGRVCFFLRHPDKLVTDAQVIYKINYMLSALLYAVL